MQTLSIEIGSRVHCEGDFGTVLYVGPIDELEGTWIGVEWDNPSRGKHSGDYKNKVYFVTSVSNAGSFIKTPKANTGISCVEAITIKYGKNSESVNASAFINLPQKSGLQRQIEVVGIEKILRKQSNYANLTEIILNGMLVKDAGIPGKLNDTMPNIRNLDLSENLLSSWKDVHEITGQLPRLSTLVLSKNRLKIPEDCEHYKDSFKSLRTLILNDMTYNWHDVLSCAVMWPHISDLKVLGNRINELEIPPEKLFCNLRSLHLSNNSIRSWNEICKLGKLANLEELYLDNIGLESIDFPNTSSFEKTQLFANLKSLFLRDNKLSQWEHISELNKLLSLENLKVMNNPIIETVSPGTARQLIIAKIQGLKILKGTPIEKSERRGAEIDYLKSYRAEWASCGEPKSLSQNVPSVSFFKKHPTYLLLLQRHGEADENEIKMQSTLLKDNLINVIIFSPLMPEKLPLTKKLPAEMTVAKLKALVQRIFKVSAHEVSITIIFKEDESQKTIMDNNLRQLSFYSLSDEDKICVEW